MEMGIHRARLWICAVSTLHSRSRGNGWCLEMDFAPDDTTSRDNRRVDALKERRYTQVLGLIGCLWQGESIFPSCLPTQFAQASRVMLHEARRLSPRTRENVAPVGHHVAA